MLVLVVVVVVVVLCRKFDNTFYVNLTSYDFLICYCVLGVLVCILLLFAREGNLSCGKVCRVVQNQNQETGDETPKEMIISVLMFAFAGVENP